MTITIPMWLIYACAVLACVPTPNFEWTVATGWRCTGWRLGIILGPALLAVALWTNRRS